MVLCIPGTPTVGLHEFHKDVLWATKTEGIESLIPLWKVQIASIRRQHQPTLPAGASRSDLVAGNNVGPVLYENGNGAVHQNGAGASPPSEDAVVRFDEGDSAQPSSLRELETGMNHEEASQQPVGDDIRTPPGTPMSHSIFDDVGLHLTCLFPNIPNSTWHQVTFSNCYLTYLCLEQQCSEAKTKWDKWQLSGLPAAADISCKNTKIFALSPLLLL